MINWLKQRKALVASVVVFLGLAGLGAATLLWETLPGGVWHRNRLTGAKCYIKVYCWKTDKDPFGKGLKLPDDPFGKIDE